MSDKPPSEGLAVEVKSLHKSYHLGRTTLHVLRGVSFAVRSGQFVSVVGASGSGKSTLLHLVGLLDRPDSGAVMLDGVDAVTLSRQQRNRNRCREIGFVFQFYHLLPELDVMENTLLPAKVDSSVLEWLSRGKRESHRAMEVLEQVGLKDRVRHRPKELSGGERQRVAIARALMNRPRLLLADEPTGNLDSKTGKQIMKVLRDAARESGATVIMVTHDAELAAQSDRVIHIVDGKLAE